MSKKKFTNGLESIFSDDDPKVSAGRGAAFLRDGFAPEDKPDAPPEARKPSVRKTFTTDLDSLLEEALQESFQEQMGKPGNDSKAKVFHQQTHRRRPLSGLDMLIRRTVEAGAIEIENDDTGVKRLTVTFDRSRLEKLKKIARIEKAYLKDILGDIVAEYIKKYETKKGIVE